MKISEVAARSGMPAKTIRYYEETGLLPRAQRKINGYRTYSEQDVQSLRFIHRARGLGFSVEDVASLLDLWRDKRRASADVKALALRHIARIEHKMKELATVRAALSDLAARCQGDERPECPILDGLAAEDEARSAEVPSRVVTRLRRR